MYLNRNTFYTMIFNENLSYIQGQSGTVAAPRPTTTTAVVAIQQVVSGTARQNAKQTQGGEDANTQPVRSLADRAALLVDYSIRNCNEQSTDN